MNIIWVSILCAFQYLNILVALIEATVPAFAEVTYPGIGHFTTRDFYDPIHRPVVFLPKSPEKINTKFFLYTRNNLNQAQVLKVGNHSSIKSSYFNVNHSTKFIVHGFFDNKQHIKWMRKIKDEFIMADNHNVIKVDWSGGNGFPYGKAVANTRVVGAVIALLIDDLKAVLGLDLNTVHILGHSLGSHIAGHAGEKLNGQIGRITGLDPGGPYYRDLNFSAAKLDSTDAQFVDVIHTDAERLIPTLGLGMYETSGHLDFYPNGGTHQPGCYKERWVSMLTKRLGPMEGARHILACDHQRAVDLYLTTIIHKYTRGVGYQCKDYESFLDGQCVDCGTGDKCAILGSDAVYSKKFKNTTQGKRFFLTTTGKYPYFTNEYEIQIKMAQPANDRLSNNGRITVTIVGSYSKETVKLNAKKRLFDLGKSYNFIKNIGLDLGDIKSVTFHWQRFWGSKVKQLMWIDSIRIVPLSSKNVFDREQHLKEIKTFCTNNRNEGLKIRNYYTFSVVCE